MERRKAKKRRWWKIPLAFVVVVVVGGIAATQVPIPSAWMFRFMGWQIERGRVRIFCKSDHEALLRACRDLSKRADVGRHETRVYEVGIFSRLSLPRPIRALRPREVIVSGDGIVRISMFSGWHPFGVWACPEGYEGRRPDKAKRKLLEGLWYYDEDYNYSPERLDKQIDALIDEHQKK